MRTFFLLICLALAMNGFSQNSNKDLNEKHEQLEKLRKPADSIPVNQDSLLFQVNKYKDSVDMAQQTERNNNNLDGLVSMMKERDRKAKQQMWMRLGFGAVLLIVGIYGFTRKRKKTTGQV